MNNPGAGATPVAGAGAWSLLVTYPLGPSDAGAGDAGGDGAAPDAALPSLKASSLSVGSDQTCAVTTAGALYCWGHFSYWPGSSSPAFFLRRT